jgi:hypothetical protein
MGIADFRSCIESCRYFQFPVWVVNVCANVELHLDCNQNLVAAENLTNLSFVLLLSLCHISFFLSSSFLIDLLLLSFLVDSQ